MGRIWGEGGGGGLEKRIAIAIVREEGERRTIFAVN
jgi:hypothetical protein